MTRKSGYELFACLNCVSKLDSDDRISTYFDLLSVVCLKRGNSYCIKGLNGRLGLQKVVSRIFESAHEGGKIVSPKHWPPLPPREISGTHFC